MVTEADVTSLFMKVLWIALAMSLLGLFDELNKPARRKSRSRGGTWTQHDAQGEQARRKKRKSKKGMPTT